MQQVQTVAASQFAALHAAVACPSRVIRLTNDVTAPKDSPVATSSSTLTIPSEPLRTRQTQLRQPCTFIKAGSTSVVFGLSRLAIKFSILNPSGAAAPTSSTTPRHFTLRSASSFEADAAAVAYMLTTGLSGHVMQPFGTLPFTIEVPTFTTVRGCCVDGFVTERVEGILMNDRVTRARDLAEFIAAGLERKLVFGTHDMFPDALRALIFQVFYILDKFDFSLFFTFNHHAPAASFMRVKLPSPFACGGPFFLFFND